MLAAHHYCSKHQSDRLGRLSIFTRILSLGAVVALAGCNSSSGWESLTSGVSSTKTAAEQAPVNVDTNVTSSTKRKVVTARKTLVKRATLGYQQPELSAKCRQILANAGIETTILRSPTVSAEANDDGNLGGSISYDLVDLQKARLKDELALVQCRRHAASTRIAQLLVTSPQSLTRSGHLAKANFLSGRAGSFRQIRQEISRSLNNGLITVQTASRLRQHLNTVRSTEAKARSEATRRQAVDSIQSQQVSGLDQELLQAEREAHHLQKQLRTADAVKVNLTGGYSADSNNNNQVLSEDRGAYAKVKVSLRLGALRPQRYAFEDELISARQDGLYERNTGVFWKASEIGRANNRALSSLNRQRNRVRVALRQADRNANLRSSDYDTETRAVAIRGKIDRLALKADLAGLNATVADTKRIAQKLKYR